MQLSQERVHQFQELYKARFGVELAYEEADRMGTELITLMKSIYQPMPAEKHDGDRGPPN